MLVVAVAEWNFIVVVKVDLLVSNCECRLYVDSEDLLRSCRDEARVLLDQNFVL